MAIGNRKHLAALVAMTSALVLVQGTGSARADATAVIAMPNCCVSDVVDYGGNVYAIAQQPPGPNSETPTLVRIDPGTNTITGSLDLPNGTSSGNALDSSPMIAAGGSIWVVSYFHNVVVRVNPTTMTVAATVPVGRSPSSIVYDGRFLWVALNNAQSVLRIDPARNQVVQTVAVGSKDTSDSPWQLAYDGTQVLASMPNSGRVARIDPATAKVRYDAVGAAAASCAHLLPAPGGYWLDDTECSPTYYRWDARRSRITATLDPTTPTHGDWGAVVVNNALYTTEYECPSDCTQGLIVKRDAATGAEIAQQSVGTEAELVHFATGSFWAGDFFDSTLQRVANF